MRQDDFASLVRLWTLRALHWKGTLYRFVGHEGFYDHDVAKALDLHDWLDESDDAADVRNKLLRSALPTHRITQLVQELKNREAQNDRQKGHFYRKAVVAILNAMLRLAEEGNARKERRGPPHFEQNCALLRKAYGLSEVETKILRLSILKDQDGLISDTFALCETKTRWAHIELLATVLDETPASIDGALAPRSRLIRLKLIEACKNRSNFLFVSSDDELSRRICFGPCTLEDIFRDIAREAPRPTLGYRHYPHLSETLKALRQYLRTALRRKTPGVNIFLHGLPGTGKSELSRVLAREMRTQLYEISSEDAESKPIAPQKRLEALVKTSEIMQHRRAILVFDEAEDVFRAPTFHGRSLASERKGWTNRMLENNPVPLIWIANTPGDLDPAFARRFDFFFEVKSPPRRLRKKLYHQLCGRSVPAETLRKAAECDALTPAVVKRAKTVTETIFASHPAMDYQRIFEQRLEQALKAQGHEIRPFSETAAEIPGVSQLNYLNTSKPLDSTAAALKTRADCRICLFGPSGTGKTTLGHRLAREVDRPLHLKKASDLLGPFVGQTERALAHAFREASEDNAVLLIDEIDGFLRDRRDAQRSWEVQQVNELLTQMEQFNGTFIASTNLMDGIEPAALRRFDLKIHFDFLRADQIIDLLQKHIAQLGISERLTEACQAIASLPNATPGDFANVARQHHFQQFPTAREFANAVVDECRMKTGPSGKQMGFF